MIVQLLKKKLKKKDKSEMKDPYYLGAKDKGCEFERKVKENKGTRKGAVVLV